MSLPSRERELKPRYFHPSPLDSLVAPFAGARVETTPLLISRGMLLSRSLRGSAS